MAEPTGERHRAQDFPRECPRCHRPPMERQAGWWWCGFCHKTVQEPPPMFKWRALAMTAADLLVRVQGAPDLEVIALFRVKPSLPVERLRQRLIEFLLADGLLGEQVSR